MIPIMHFKFKVESILSKYSIDGLREVRTINLAPYLDGLKIGSNIDLVIDDPKIWNHFELGKAYFVDFGKI